MSRTDPQALAAGPYRTPAPLSARAAIYAWQHPRVDLPAAAIVALADVPQHGLVVDAGCGPGRYVHRLRAARPDLRCLAVDISAGMLHAIDDRHVLRAVGSADALPLPRHAADAALAMHMLYHLPDPQAGLTELRRIVRPGGLLVASTDDDHQDALWRIFRDAGLDRAPVSARWPLAEAAAMVRVAGFDDVHEQVFDYVLEIPATQPVLDYLDSCRTGFPDLPDEAWTTIRHSVAATVGARIRRHGSLRRAGRVGIVTGR
jgi:SAM-dependent methyltransferase